ncbi:hypothetical protein RRG08_033524 [Elysia crispata]|uniref:Uncharacterized protein n=1 Tax=Elysia crispata TaxID=231223 RepID=A0AAE0XNR0_9GAST|nr:hypothetical protein RRG08_033524 [Elysia crispata]
MVVFIARHRNPYCCLPSDESNVRRIFTSSARFTTARPAAAFTASQLVHLQARFTIAQPAAAAAFTASQFVYLQALFTTAPAAAAAAAVNTGLRHHRLLPARCKEDQAHVD